MKAIIYALFTIAATNPAHADIELLDRSCLAFVTYVFEEDLFRTEVTDAFDVMRAMAAIGIPQDDRNEFNWAMARACVENPDLTIEGMIEATRESFTPEKAD